MCSLGLSHCTNLSELSRPRQDSLWYVPTQAVGGTSPRRARYGRVYSLGGGASQASGHVSRFLRSQVSAGPSNCCFQFSSTVWSAAGKTIRITPVLKSSVPTAGIAKLRCLECQDPPVTKACISVALHSPGPLSLLAFSLSIAANSSQFQPSLLMIKIKSRPSGTREMGKWLIIFLLIQRTRVWFPALRSLSHTQTRKLKKKKKESFRAWFRNA